MARFGLRQNRDHRIMNYKKLIRRLHEQESGQDLVEYALVLATVLVAIVAGSNAVANVVSNALTSIMGRVQSIVQ